MTTPRTDAVYQQFNPAPQGVMVDELLKHARRLEEELKCWIDNAKEYDRCRIVAEQERDKLVDVIKNARLTIGQILPPQTPLTTCPK